MHEYGPALSNEFLLEVTTKAAGRAICPRIASVGFLAMILIKSMAADDERVDDAADKNGGLIGC